MDRIMPWLDKEYFHPNHDRNKENKNSNKAKNEIIASLGIEFIPCGTHESKTKRPLNVSQIDDDNNDNNDDYGGMTIIKEKYSTLRQAVSSTTYIEGSVVVPAPNLKPYIHGILIQITNCYII